MVKYSAVEERSTSLALTKMKVMAWMSEKKRQIQVIQAAILVAK